MSTIARLGRLAGVSSLSCLPLSRKLVLYGMVSTPPPSKQIQKEPKIVDNDNLPHLESNIQTTSIGNAEVHHWHCCTRLYFIHLSNNSLCSKQSSLVVSWLYYLLKGTLFVTYRSTQPAVDGRLTFTAATRRNKSCISTYLSWDHSSSYIIVRWRYQATIHYYTSKK